MNTTPLITVIVPLYKVEAYIERCARSLFEQTLDSIEYIFIDDCSPDGSAKVVEHVLEDYPERRELTRIITLTSNTGLAGVRRRGIIEARGEWIIHCDGDDWVDNDLYAAMLNAARRAAADIAVCDFVEELPSGPVRRSQRFSSTSPREILSNWHSNTTHMSCCNKLIKRSAYYNTDGTTLPWEGLNMWEDNGLVPRLFYNACKLVTVRGPAYHYNRLNQGAMTAGYGRKQVEQMLEVARRLESFFASKPDGRQYAEFVQTTKYLARLNLVMDSAASLKEYRRTFPQTDSIARRIPRACFSAKGYLRYWLVNHHLAWVSILLYKLNGLRR